ncbi:MAG: sugar transferase [bacterium]
MSVTAAAKRRFKILRIRNQRLRARLRRHLFPTGLFQICFSLTALIVFSPLFLLVAALVKLNSPGPFFYRGARVGLENSVFRVIKFRTLPLRYEERVGSRLLTERERYNGVLAAIIVRLKLDEMPQLLNVLMGDMALVGPRPIRPVFYSRYVREIPGYAKRFQVKPGITGLAQIVGGYYMDPGDKLKYDLLYIQNKGLILDIKIMFLTILTLVFTRRIMGLSIVRRFLGIPIAVNGDDIVPSMETYGKVTDCR